MCVCIHLPIYFFLQLSILISYLSSYHLTLLLMVENWLYNRFRKRCSLKQQVYFHFHQKETTFKGKRKALYILYRFPNRKVFEKWYIWRKLHGGENIWISLSYSDWQEQYPTRESSEQVRYCSCHANMKFIPLS